MSASLEAIEEQIDRLEQDAREIEDLYTDFFNRISTNKNKHVMGYSWQNPSDEIEELQREALQKYEVWYNTVEPLVSEYLSSRTEDFNQHYRDFRDRLELDTSAPKQTSEAINAQHADFDSQRSMLKSIPSKVQVEELRVRKQISRNVAQTELDKARELFNEGEIRVSGVITGVALERYLLMLCENSDGKISYSYRDGVSTLAQKLYEADEIDSTTEKHLQHLADIRADCAHANEEDPDKEDVRRLLEDAEDYVRGRKI